MIKYNKLAFLIAATVLTVGNYAIAKEIIGGHKPDKTALLKTAAGCDPATASIDLDINNVRTKLMTGGDMWWDIGTAEARYEIPKGSKKNSLFAGSLWVGGYTPDKQLKVAAQMYRQDGNDYWPGPLETNNGAFSIDASVCTDWDRFWKVNRVLITKFIEAAKTLHCDQLKDDQFQTIREWPARGNGAVIQGLSVGDNEDVYRSKGTSGNLLTMEDREYAPFVDLNGNGVYDPKYGEYPDIVGDQFIWWVFNDKGNIKQQSGTEAIGVEVQASAFAFSTKDFLNDATFYKYVLQNRSTNTLDSTFIATWTDADLGWYLDDYIGCDTTRGLGILYNGNAIDGNGQVNSYGSNVPMVAVDFFQGPQKYIYNTITHKDDTTKLTMTAFTYFNNSNDAKIGNPSNGVQIYNYMTGSTRNGQKFTNDFAGKCVQATGLGTGPTTKFMFYGDPDDPSGWSECNCCNPPGDRRFIHSSGPITLLPSSINEIVIGVVWTANVGGCPNASFTKIRLVDDGAQALFDNHFKTIDGPNAPRLSCRELDRKLIFYLSNPSSSNNFQEKYGTGIDSAKYRVASVKAIKYSEKHAGMNDTLYKFEGYRIFQLKNSEVQAAQIFNDKGELNADLAAEIFQCDIHNGVSQLTNWVRNINVNQCDSCYDIVTKVNGKDSGLIHSFMVNSDAFATGSDKRLVNYKTYYFVAIAYAYNNFRNFSINNSTTTQDIVYLESSSGPLGSGDPISVVGAMPNPGYQVGVGTALNSDYGDGVILKRIEGVGNGGNFLQLEPSAEDDALQSSKKYQSNNPTYVAGNGPVNIKVIDPIKVPNADWSIYVYADTVRFPSNSNFVILGSGIDTFAMLNANYCSWKLINETTNDTIYNEKGLNLINEQLLSEYGISVKIGQVVKPGVDQQNGNGYISSDVTFTNSSYAWLAGVPDGEQRSVLNWIRSGKNSDPIDNSKNPPVLCDFSDSKSDTIDQVYESLLSNNSFTKATWSPYSLSAETRDINNNPDCGFGPAYKGSRRALADLTDVDVVFTNDKSKWSKCVVVEANDLQDITQGFTDKFSMRSHRSWTGDVDQNGNPIYASSATDTGFSYFPGYAINLQTGERLNIIFSEDSYQTNNNGGDMIWNPTSTILDNFGNMILGGKHFVYISKTKYDGGAKFATLFAEPTGFDKGTVYKSIIWVGCTTLSPNFKLLSLKDGLIPTETRLRFRVTRPYARYIPDATANLKNGGFPFYTFTTTGLAKLSFNDGTNTDANKYLDRIQAVPNPYYAHVGYEINRLDTRVRIVGLPQKATVSVYSLDGTLVRRLSKDNASIAYLDWDIRNEKSLPVASGMYLIHVQAEGIGEKVIKWFGAMRPVDITSY